MGGKYEIVPSVEVQGSKDREELQHLWTLAVPSTLNYIMLMLQKIICVMFVGQLGSVELAGAALGLMFINVTGLSIGFGLGTALDTLCSQAYGAGEEKNGEARGGRHMVGVHCQRGMFIMALLVFPIGLVFMAAEQLLLLTGQDAEISFYAGRMSKIFIPALPAAFFLEVVQRFLQVQSQGNVLIAVTSCTTMLTPPLAWLLIYYTGFGFDGCAYTMAVTNILSALILCLVIAKFPELRSDCWGGFTTQALTGWTEFFRLGYPGLVMICAEWWAFEVLAIFAGWVSKPALATQSILNNILCLAFVIPLGLGDAAAIRVGNHLAAGRPKYAKNSARLTLIVTVVAEVGIALFIAGTRDRIPLLFTSDPDVLKLASPTLLLLSCFIIFDGIQGVLSGILRGSGLQEKAARINLVAFYAIALPISYVSGCRAGLGILGIWGGIFVATTIQVLWMGVVTWQIQWDLLSDLAISRAQCDLENYSSVCVVALSPVSQVAHRLPLRSTPIFTRVGSSSGSF